MWVADMDFRSPQPIVDALRARVEEGVFGYSNDVPGLRDAICARLAARNQWSVAPDDLIYLPGLVCGLNVMTRAVGKPGDAVLANTPVYGPFLSAPTNQGRVLQMAEQHMAQRDGHLYYEIDFDALEAAVTPETELFILCNPHNPLGRAWSRGELEELAALARRYDVRVVADEIHGPLTLPGATFTPYLTVDERAVVVTSASKSFNMPAVHGAQLVLLDEGDRARARALPVPAQNAWSSLGIVAGVAAWSEGDPWLAALVERLDDQRRLLGEVLAAELPEARMRPLEATYLAWLDLRAYADDPAAAALAAGVRLGPGPDYQPGLPGHTRVNLATSPTRLREILQRLVTGLRVSGS